MISILIYCHKKKEAEELYQLCRYCTALLGDDHLVPHIYYDGESFWDGQAVVQKKGCAGTKKEEAGTISDWMRETGLSLDMILFEIRGEADILELKKIRTLFSAALLLVMTDSRISPEKYLLPSLRPIMLLLRPFEKKKVMAHLWQFYGYYYEQRDGLTNKDRMIIRGREGVRYLSCGRIRYIEAREKKIFLRYDGEEVSFYHTLKKIEEVLPKYFVRCHRSYIVNTRYISRINFSQNTLLLTGDIVIPISHKYRKMILDLLEKDAPKLL